MMTTAVARAQATLPLIGRTGLVTGASSGLGKAIAIELGRAGAGVYVGYNKHDDNAALVVREIEAAGGQAEPLCLQVEHRPTFIGWNIDFLVNNAGITAGRSVRNTTEVDWQRCLDVNLTGTFLMTQAVLPGMIERKYGRIVNLTSVVGLTGRLGPASYAASKAGVVGFTKAAALELARKGITVNAIAPGFIADTGLWPAQVDPELQKKVLSEIPMGRWGRPHEVAQAALYLIAYGDYVTGTVLNVSGGWHT